MAGVGVALFGDWALATKTLLEAPRHLRKAKDVALLQEAEFFRTKILEGMREQAPGGKAFKPLSPYTLAIRRFLGFKGSKALLKRGDLRNSIVVLALRDADGTVFVGVTRQAKNAEGDPLVDIAKLNEFGSKPIVIRITPKMSAFLHAAFRRANLPSKNSVSTGIIIVQIPARPFLAPIFDKFGQSEEAAKRFAERVAKQMRGKGPWAVIGDALR